MPSEAPPTFHVSPDRVVGIIAGGDRARESHLKGKEDDENGAVAALRALSLTPDDCVIGIAAGGSTPYARGAVTWAAQLTPASDCIFISCSPCKAPVGCQHLIVASTGPEPITGSTRMKAGGNKIDFKCGEFDIDDSQWACV